MGDDGLDLTPLTRSLPEERLGELAAADPEEAGHLGVELASRLPLRRSSLALTAGCRPDRRVGGELVTPVGGSVVSIMFTMPRIVATKHQRAVFGT